MGESLGLERQVAAHHSHSGRTEVFVESRVIAWTTDVSPQARQMPFILGVNIYYKTKTARFFFR